MGTEYYVFAGYIFLLLALLLLLFIKGRSSKITKPLKELKEREAEILEAEEMLKTTMAAFDLRVQDAMDKIDRAMKELEAVGGVIGPARYQGQAEALINKRTQAIESAYSEPEKAEAPWPDDDVPEVDFIGPAESSFKTAGFKRAADKPAKVAVKTAEAQQGAEGAEGQNEVKSTKSRQKYEDVRELLEKGYTEDEIIRSLNITRGEVKFITGLWEKNRI